MLSIDTNILFYAFNCSSPKHETARAWIASVAAREDVALSEFVLAEFYGLLRNPAVSPNPLSAGDAVEVVEAYRRHPAWRVVSLPEQQRALHDRVWKLAGSEGFAFRRLI